MAEPLRARAASGSGRSVAVGLVVAVGFLLAACTQEANPSVVPASPSPAHSGSAPSDGGPSIEPTAGPTIDPALAQGLTVTCGDGRTFPAELLVNAGLAENELEPASRKLREVVGGPDGQGLPTTGWHWVIKNPDAALFVAPATGPDVDAWQMVALVNNAGTWEIDSTGSCRLSVVLPAGVGQASWWVDPAVGLPPATGTTVAGFLQEYACASGRSPEGRVLGPIVDYKDASIFIWFAVRMLPGDQDCPSNPTFPVRFELDQPLGNRKLFDSGVFPARDASVVPN